MAELKDVVVPDIGDFSEVPIIEVMVAPGDTVAEEDPLVTLESDKATMDVPSPFRVVRPAVPPSRNPRARESAAAHARSPIRWKPNIE